MQLKAIIIIPAYNEEKNILKLIREIKEKAPSFDYVIINDCSTDNTLSLCRENMLNYINLDVNLGIGGCVQTGYKYACINNYDVAVQIDGDGQHDPVALERMLEEMDSKEANFVVGSRFIDYQGFQSTYLRRIGIKFLSTLIYILTGKKIHDVTSGLRLGDRKIIKLFSEFYPQDYPEPESTVTVIKKGYKIIEYPVMMKEREHGSSSINFLRSIYYMIKVSLAIIVARIK